MTLYVTSFDKCISIKLIAFRSALSQASLVISSGLCAIPRMHVCRSCCIRIFFIFRCHSVKLLRPSNGFSSTFTPPTVDFSSAMENATNQALIPLVGKNGGKRIQWHTEQTHSNQKDEHRDLRGKPKEGKTTAER